MKETSLHWVGWAIIASLLAGAQAGLREAQAAQGPPAGGSRGGESGALVLNENGCWRRYYCFGPNLFSPAVLKAEGEKVLKARFARLKQDTEKGLRAKGLDPGQVDWRDHAVLTLGGGARSFDPLPTPQPPGDWMASDFDDSGWVRQRGFFQGGRFAQITAPNLGQYDESVDLRLQAAFYRARFLVTDPADAAALALRVAYSGGVRVFLNGQEIARGRLPQGDLAPDTAAEDYPQEAYGPNGATLCRRTLGPVSIPPQRLRKGVNVLAVEVRASRFHPIVLTNPTQPNWGGPMRPWPHARLFSVELGPASQAIPSALRRPAGVQVWAEDMHHRTLSSDFLPPGEAPGTLRLVGARNATCSAQVVVGTDKEITGLQVRASELKAPEGARRLAASAIQVLHMAPYPLDSWTLKQLGDERGLGASFPDAAELAAGAAMSERGKAYLFDQLTQTPPASIPAGSARPIWLSVRIPSDAAPGQYRGAVEVSAKGLPYVSLPIVLEIVDWRLPDPKDFQTFVGCEQNPYGVARQYGLPLWSAEHFQRLEPSFQQLARVGNRWLNVPILANTEFGNKGDSMVRWVRRKDGTLAFDYGILDRYLDLAIKHWGPPRVIQFVVMQGMKSRDNPPRPPRVSLDDEAAGKRTLAEVPRGDWTAFARALYAHLKARGLEKAMFWGAPLEGEDDPDLKTFLAACTPGVFWTAGPHEMMSNGVFAKREEFYKIVTDIRYHGGWPSFRDDQGWKSKTLHLLNPRVGGTAFALHTTSLPFAYRAMVDRALALGRSGFTRVGADEWAAIHYDSMEIPKWLTGLPVLFTLWPGKDGAESSARFEALLEGIQETEARIFLEQALDRGRVPQPLAGRVRKALADRFRETAFWQGNSLIHSMEQYHYRWQERSQQLYRAAAEVAALLPSRVPK